MPVRTLEVFVLISEISFRMQVTDQHVNSRPMLVQFVDVRDVGRL